MGPRALVFTVGVVNVVLGMGLGIAVDRTLLPQPPAPPQPQPEEAKVGEPKVDEPSSKPPKRGDKGMRGRRHLERLAKALELDAEQKEKVHAIFQARRSEAKKIFKEIRPRLEAIRKDTFVELKTVLTPEQMTKLETMHKDMEKRWKSRRGRRGEGRGSWRGGWNRRGGPPGRRGHRSGDDRPRDPSEQPGDPAEQPPGEPAEQQPDDPAEQPGEPAEQPPEPTTPPGDRD